MIPRSQAAGAGQWDKKRGVKCRTVQTRCQPNRVSKELVVITRADLALWPSSVTGASRRHKTVHHRPALRACWRALTALADSIHLSQRLTPAGSCRGTEARRDVQGCLRTPAIKAHTVLLRYIPGDEDVATPKGGAVQEGLQSVQEGTEDGEGGDAAAPPEVMPVARLTHCPYLGVGRVPAARRLRLHLQETKGRSHTDISCPPPSRLHRRRRRRR